jgi:hypothetical protein
MCSLCRCAPIRPSCRAPWSGGPWAANAAGTGNWAPRSDRTGPRGGGDGTAGRCLATTTYYARNGRSNVPRPRRAWPARLDLAAPPLSPLAATACARALPAPPPDQDQLVRLARSCPHLILSSNHSSAGSATGSTQRSRRLNNGDEQ